MEKIVVAVQLSYSELSELNGLLVSAIGAQVKQGILSDRYLDLADKIRSSMIEAEETASLLKLSVPFR